jgi:FlaA1/EpsC-like NDP-sugar epimerase
MRNRYILLADLPLIAIAAAGAFTLRFDLLFPQHRPEFVPFLLAALVIKPLVFHAFGMYGRYWKYAGVQELLAVALAVSASSVAMALFVIAWAGAGFVSSFSREVIIIDWLLMLAAVGGLRMSVRVLGDARERARKGNGGTRPKRVLVAGAGEAGSLVVREMQRNPQLGLLPVGFLDDAPTKHGSLVHGVRVLGPLTALAEVVKGRHVDEVVIAMPAISGSVVRAVAETCRQAGVKSRTMPGVFELLDGQVRVSRLRNVEIADLLRRSQVIGNSDAASYVEGRVVLVTGAGGSIGSELCRQVALGGPSCLVLLGHGENSIFEAMLRVKEASPSTAIRGVIADVRDRARMAQVFSEFLPAIVFHAAAHKHVPLMEENPGEAVTNNVLGTQSVVDAALESGTERFVLISTDKAVSPTNVMGASKRLAGMIVRRAAAQSGRAFIVVRFGNVLGSRGSVVPIFKRQIERGGPVTVTHPAMKRFFMTIPEAVHLVIVAAGIGTSGELFVLNMGEQVRIVDLAQDLIKLSGLKPEEVKIAYTGVRAGEKMEEGLWEEGAIVESTINPDVLKVIEPETLPLPDLPDVIRALDAAAGRGDRLEIEALLAQCIPTFVPALSPASSHRTRASEQRPAPI